MHPTVSVIVLNYRTPQVTAQCVENLQKQNMGNMMEIIVADNHSTDDSIGILRNRLRRYKNVKIIETQKNIGFGSGYNFAARFASGTFLLINNPQKILQPDAVKRLSQQMESDASIGIIAPKLMHPDGTIRESARAFPTPLDLMVKRTVLQHIFLKRLHRYLQPYDASETPRDVDWVVGGCFMINRKLYLEISGFDESFFLFFEDTDLCRRVRQKGKRIVYDPTIYARDRKERLSEGGIMKLLLTKTGREHMKSAARYFWKWRSDPKTSS